MKATRSLLHLALCLVSVSSVTASWPRWMEEMHLVVRQDSGSDSNATPTNTDKAVETGKATAETSSTKAKQLNTATPLDPNNPPEETGNSKSNSTKTDKEEFPATAPAGSVNMITPNIYLGTTLVKAGSTATFSWNYTNLLAEPTAVDVILVQTAASKTWTLTANMSFATDVEYKWDTNVQYKDSKQPLLTEKYNFIIKDSDADLGEQSSPGYLAQKDLPIGIYTPQPYSPLDSFFCATCSSAMMELPDRALKVAGATAVITVLSFTWFVAGLGVF